MNSLHLPVHNPRFDVPARDPAWHQRLFWIIFTFLLLWPLTEATEFRPSVLFEAENMKISAEFIGSFFPPVLEPDLLARILRETWKTVAIATAGMVLALMALPTVIIATRSALKAVPPSIREAAWGVGASRTQTVFHHVLPQAMPGVMTGTILSLAHALGETAPLLMIGMIAFNPGLPESFTSSASVLPVQVFIWETASERAFHERTAAAIIVLLVFMIAMNAAAVILRRRCEMRAEQHNGHQCDMGFSLESSHTQVLFHGLHTGASRMSALRQNPLRRFSGVPFCAPIDTCVPPWRYLYEIPDRCRSVGLRPDRFARFRRQPRWRQDGRQAGLHQERKHGEGSLQEEVMLLLAG